MGYKTGTYTDGTVAISDSENISVFNNFNYGNTRYDVGGNADPSVRFDPSQGLAESAITSVGLGQGGCAAQVGHRFQTYNYPTKDLEIIVDCNWKGILEILVDASAGLKIDALLIDDQGPVWPEVGSDYVIDTIELVSVAAGPADTVSPVTVEDNEYTDGESGNPSPLLLKNPPNAKTYRVVVYVQTTSSVPIAYGTGRSDANSNSANGFKGKLRLNALYFNWG